MSNHTTKRHQVLPGRGDTGHALRERRERATAVRDAEKSDTFPLALRLERNTAPRRAACVPFRRGLLGRRGFLASLSTYGFSAVMLSASERTSASDADVARAAREDERREANAKQTMVLATEYKLTDEVSIPVVQSAFKRYLEEFSRGELYVDLRPAGELGLGAALANKVATGAVHAAQYSLANFSSYVPAVDVINIPYWCGDNQRYANLVSSESWASEMDPKLAARGFKVLFYYTEDPRTIAMTKAAAPQVVRTPADLNGVTMRVPNSKIMTQFYRLAGAVPVLVPWGDTFAALQRGAVDALDPAVATLYTVGFLELLGSISCIASVPDAQVYACNLDWFRALPQHLRRAVEDASERAMAESFMQVPSCRAYSMAQMEKAGVRSYKPTAAELERWAETTGEQRPEWNQFKIELLGSVDAFDKLKAAANTKGRYTVNDY